VSGSGRPGRAAGQIPDAKDADRALARERTELAWTRSSISFAALGLLIMKFRPVVGAPVLAFSAVIWALGRLPRRAGSSASRRVLLVTVAVTALAAAALALTLIGHGSRGLRL